MSPPTKKIENHFLTSLAAFRSRPAEPAPRKAGAAGATRASGAVPSTVPSARASPATPQEREDLHVSERVARARAAVSNQRNVKTLIASAASPSSTTIASGSHTSPPSAACRSARMPQYGGSAQEIGRVQVGQDRGREEQPGCDPHRVLEEIRQGVGVPVEHEGRREDEAHQAQREHGRRQRERELPGMHEVQRDAEDDAAPDERRHEGVHAGEGVRERERQVDQRQRRRRADAELEGALPALPLDHPARAEQRRRPDAHHPGAERGVQQRPRTATGLEHVERDRREDDRLHDRREQEEAGRPEHLQVRHEPAADDAERVHASTSAM